MFRSTTISDGTIDEIELTPEQALDLGSGEAIAYLPRDEPGRRLQRPDHPPRVGDPRATGSRMNDQIADKILQRLIFIASNLAAMNDKPDSIAAAVRAKR